MGLGEQRGELAYFDLLTWLVVVVVREDLYRGRESCGGRGGGGCRFGPPATQWSLPKREREREREIRESTQRAWVRKVLISLHHDIASSYDVQSSGWVGDGEIVSCQRNAFFFGRGLLVHFPSLLFCVWFFFQVTVTFMVIYSE